MTSPMPVLATGRLLIRPFRMDDLEAIHHLLEPDLPPDDPHWHDLREPHRQWLQWTVLGYEQFARLHQPPYGDRAIELKASGEVAGMCGFAPCLDSFQQLPAFHGGWSGEVPAPVTAEVGLFWSIATVHRRRGYATEAGQALIDYGFRSLRLKRIVATTAYDNLASVGVMEKLGMRIEHNPFPNPPWLQVVGLLENP